MAATLPSELGDEKTIGPPAWWLRRLEASLNARLPQLARNEKYYRGDHELAFAMERFRVAFGKTFKTFANNWMPMVVDACVERLRVEGFRIPTGEEDDPQVGDTEAWDIWQANNLDGYSALFMTDVLAHGPGYVIVGPGEEFPEITTESGFEVICESAPGYRMRRLAALKRWQDSDGHMAATLYLPEEIWKLRSARPVEGRGLPRDIAWVAREVPGEQWPLRNAIGVVPVVPFYNRPRLMVPYEGEFQQLIPMQNACNKLFMDMMVAAEYAAFRQRYIAGIEVPRDPVTNETLTSFKKQALDMVLTSPSAETKFGTMEATGLDNYVHAIETVIQNIATQSKTPPHYFFLKGELPSGEALDVDTPVPTPSGWTTMGALRAGDEVLDERGEPTRVTEAFPIMYDRPCYRVRFDDGAEVVADAKHRWYVKRPNGQHRKVVLTTAELLTESTYPTRFAVPAGAATQFADADLPVGPYTLGAWLGDGTLGQGNLTAHVDDAPGMAARLDLDAGVADRVYVYTPNAALQSVVRIAIGRDPAICWRGHEREVGSKCAVCEHLTYRGRVYGETPPPPGHRNLRGRLAELGVLWNKHIPEVYLTASYKQRLELLRGLMDTDGTIGKNGHSCLGFTNERLTCDAQRLIWSLGWKANLTTKPERTGSTSYRLHFAGDVAPVSMMRKLARWRAPVGRGAARQRWRYIETITPAPSRPVRCITVASDSHLYLAGRALVVTHNTLKSAETPLVTKVRGKMQYLGESWEEVMRLAFLWRGDEARANVSRSSETLWADPETRSESEHIDALVKQKALGVPDEILWAKAGYSPQEIARIKQIKAAEPAPPANGQTTEQMQQAMGVATTPA